MFQIRQGVFETNSSSTHSITICPLSDFQKWMNDEVYFNNCIEKFVTLDEALEYISSHGDGGKEDAAKLSSLEKEDAKFHEILNDYDVYSYDDFFDDGYYDNLLYTYRKDYTTENGDEVVAFGLYGFDY